MSQAIIQNQSLRVTIALLGAEVRSVRNAVNNHEYMWSGDPAVWAGVSPVLFPVVGKTSANQVKFAGESYTLGNHGFARHSIFSIVQQKEDEVTLLLNTQAGDAKRYPFNLDFFVNYKLIDKTLQTTYMVHNLNKQTAYFSVGAHPAFACPFDDKHQITDYEIRFEQPENLRRHEITSEAFYTGKTTEHNLAAFNLDEHTFDDDALVFSGYNGDSVSLVERDSGRAIQVSLDGFPWLGIWSKPGANYVCLEPWCGRSDDLGFSGDVNSKAAIETIQPNAKWSRSYTIQFTY
ncbi:MAG: aldose 1-epimerase family protein [Neisseriaceae bacterium]|nr:MAG: aldose 1-epimerase family protein [Neisseriaceae bacterium]